MQPIWGTFVKLFRVIATALAVAGVYTGPAFAATQTVPFSGTFLGGSFAPFPVAPAQVYGSLSYDPTNSSVISPDIYPTAAWYYNAVTQFSFTSTGGAITGSYSSGGGGTFAVYNNNGGAFDSLFASVQVPGLTGNAPTGFQLVSAGLYFYDQTGTALSSVDLPSTIDAHLLSGFEGKLFTATYAAINNPEATATIYVAVTGVPEPSTWAMMLLGFLGLGFAARRAKPRPA